MSDLMKAAEQILETGAGIGSKQIVRMARQAGFQAIEFYEFTPGNELYKCIHRLAALVAAYEREACAGIAERRILVDANKDQRTGHYEACKNIAAAIRSRT